jgi:type IV fimbrial biogenesis protein FimT
MKVIISRTGPALRGPLAGRGFTLVELMIAIAVFAILLAIAVPSFRDASLGARLSSIANNMVASVQLARSEAIKRNAAITLCASSDGSTCDDDVDWDTGWVVRDDGAGTVIQVQQSLPAGWKLTQSGGTSQLSFQPIGVGATAATFTACRSNPVGKQERVVTVTATGMAYVTSTATGTCP